MRHFQPSEELNKTTSFHISTYKQSFPFILFWLKKSGLCIRVEK